MSLTIVRWDAAKKRGAPYLSVKFKKMSTTWMH